ncbi:hypothetical protein NL526_29000, partial [Klebsiella pneumoniae]|nr:hypothetical protein [Klebsiella pneumoniae]
RSSDTSATPFASTARTYRLPEKILAMCSLQSNGECRLAASFEDDTVRVFRVSGGTLNELQRVAQPPDSNWEPITLVALPGGSLT